ncbi:MAG: hypothetical protein MK110_01915 [Fuerstiella sp.]|nr:hypothetical protein [Fuerstiella sp.]
MSANTDLYDKEISGRIVGAAKSSLPVEITERYHDLLCWIDSVLDSSLRFARPVSEFTMQRLPGYYSEGFLSASRAIICKQCPAVPLTEFGLRDDALPSPSDAAGFTLRDVYFVTHESVDDESTHFHELIHVVQWHILGDECFFHLYASGLLSAGYRLSPLEEIAYDLQSRFDSDDAEFDVIMEVRRRLANLCMP